MRLVTRAALVAVSAALLSSCSGSSSKDSGAPTITVSGRVLDHDRQPIPFVAVVVGDRAPVFTGPDGGFTVAGVATPYDATAVFSGAWVLTYVGLTRADPTLYWIDFNAGGTGLCRASLQGEVTPYAPGEAPTVVLDSTPPTEAYRRASWPGGAADHWEYTLNPYWYGPETLAGTLHALRWTLDASYLPQAYMGASAAVTMNDGDYAATAPALTLAPLPAGTVSGTIAPFANAEVSTKMVDVRYPGGATIRPTWDSSPSPEFSYVVPGIPGATFDVTVNAFGPEAGRVEARALDLAPGASGVTIAMAPPPALTSPADGATGVTAATPLTWTPFADAVHVVTLWAEHNAPMYEIVTTGSSVTIPDLRAHGVSLNAASAYTWYVQGLAPFPDLDAVAGDARVERWVQRGSTPYRTFTTAP